MVRFFCALLLGLIGLGSASAAEHRVLIGPSLSNLDLSPHVGYHVDPDGRADASSMFQAAGQGQFRPLPNGNATFGFREGAYWFHTRLFNDGNGEERWLLVLQYSLLDNVDVYMRYPDGRIDHLASGDKLPFSARAIRYRQPNFWLNLPQHTEVELLVRAQSESSMQAPLRIYTFGSFAEMERDAQIGIGLYDGILLALFFYNTCCGCRCGTAATSGTCAIWPDSAWCCSASTDWPSNTCGRDRRGWPTTPSRCRWRFHRWRCISSPACSWS